MSASSLSGSFAKRMTACEDDDGGAPVHLRTLPPVIAASPTTPAAANGVQFDETAAAAAAAYPAHTDVVDFARSGVISRILTPTSSRNVSLGPSRGVGAGGYDGNGSRSNLNNNSSLLHPNHSTGSRSSRRRREAASPTCVSADGRSYRHNPYLASPAASQLSAMTAHGSTDNASFGEHEGSARELNLSQGNRSDRRHSLRLAHNGRSLSESNSRCSRTLAGSTALVGSLRYLSRQVSVHDSAGAAAAVSPNGRAAAAAESFCGEVSFGARSAASSVERSLRSSPGVAPFTALFAPATQAQRADGSTPSTAAPQHLDVPHVREPPPQGSGIHNGVGGGGASPESSALYQSFGSSNVTHSVNSNNPYVGVRMTPESASLLQPQALSHVRATESGSSENRAHPLAPEYDGGALVERPRSTQPQSPRTAAPVYEDPSETSFREAQQQWPTVTQPIRVAPVYSRVSRQNSQRASTPASAVRSASAGAASTPHASNLSPAERYTPTNRPALAEAPPTAIQPETQERVDSDVSPSPSQPTHPLSPASYLATPPGGWTNPHSPLQTPPNAADGAAPAGHMPMHRGESPTPPPQQQQQQQQQRALYLPPSFASAASAASAASGASSAPSASRSRDTSRAHSLVRDVTRPFSPLAHETGEEVALSPVPVAKMERVGGRCDSASPTGSTADEDVHGPPPHQQATYHGSDLRATLPPSERRPLPRFPPHNASVPAPSAAHADPAVIASTAPMGGVDASYTYILGDASGHATSPNQAAPRGGKWGGDVLRTSQPSCGTLSSTNGITVELGRSAISINHAVRPHPAPQGEAATADSEALLLKGDEEEAENEDPDEDGDDDDGITAASQRGAGAKRKKKRSRRTRKVKMLEDLPPVTSMKYLPPPPPPPPSSHQRPQPQPDPASADFQRYLAVLGRWYNRILADEADFVDVARAGVFDAAAAAHALSAAAQQTRDGQYTPYVWNAMPPVGWSPLSSPNSGPISPLSGPLPPPFTGSGGAHGSGGVAAEVHVRCPRVEQYVAPENIPAAARAVETASADATTAEAATAATPAMVKDVPGVMRWARDLEAWWFCYVFPYVAHPRHHPPPTAQLMAAAAPPPPQPQPQHQQLQYQPPQQLQFTPHQQHQVSQPYMQHMSASYVQQQHQQHQQQQHQQHPHQQQQQQQVYSQQQPYMQQLTTGAPANFSSSYTSSGSTGYEYPYGWSTATAAAVPQSVVMGHMPGVYSPASQQAQPVMQMSGSFAAMGSALQSPVYGHVPMQQAMPQPPPPMPRGYLMGMYSAY